MPYSQNKALWHPESIEKLRNNQVPTPIHVHMILSDLCNQDCSFCSYRMSGGLSTQLFATAKTKNPNRKIATEKALEIIEDCAAMGVKAIQFTGGGEPTVHKDHKLIFAAAQRAGMDTALVTNGVKLDPEHDAIQNLKWIRISVDAGTPETYSKVRSVAQSHWHKVWKNIRTLAAIKDIGVSFAVTPENFMEIYQCAELCKDNGVKNIRICAVFSDEGTDYYGDLVHEINHQVLITQELDGDGFSVIDMFTRRFNDLEMTSPDFEFCGYQYFTMYIGGDLNIYRCCDTSYTKTGLLGSIKDIRLRDFTGNYAPFDARTCKFCKFSAQNKLIGAMLKQPRDVNFV